MTKKDVDSIAYLLKRAKDNNQPKPIVFLGAGASISAGIPGTAKIIEDILETFKDKPEVKNLDADSRNYYNLMGCLNTEERHELLRSYITNKEVKINVSHIYLAQMVNEGWIDYVLTVNFDDLFLRACALFNFIPPVYDISILKDFTTTTLAERSITYLHGQYHGFWLLNTGDELKKVEEYIPTVLDRICNKRTWIIVGYSGEDTIFKQIARLGHFTNELFWVGYKDFEPTGKVGELLNKANSNTSLISGYDADSFFLKLHSELKMNTPDIFNKPFTFLNGLMNNIKDIDDVKGEHQQLFENIRKRYDVARKQTDAAIKQYENNDPTAELTTQDISNDQLKQEIIEAIVKEEYEKANDFLKKLNKNDIEIRNLLAQLFNKWGAMLINSARKQNNIDLSKEAIEKLGIAVKLNSTESWTYNHWGNALTLIANKTNNYKIYEEAVEKYRLAIKNDNKNGPAFYNLALALFRLGEEYNNDQYCKEAIENFKVASDLEAQNSNVYNNWAAAILYFANKNKDRSLYDEAIEKCQIAIKLDPKNAFAYNNWGNALVRLAKMESNEILYRNAIEKYRISADINPQNGIVYSNWANSLIGISKIVPKDERTTYLKLAIEKAFKAIEFGQSPYNLACCFALVNEKQKALSCLEEVLNKKQISIDHVKDDDDWKDYYNDEDFKSLINKYSN